VLFQLVGAAEPSETNLKIAYWDALSMMRAWDSFENDSFNSCYPRLTLKLLLLSFSLYLCKPQSKICFLVAKNKENSRIRERCSRVYGDLRARLALGVEAEV